MLRLTACKNSVNLSFLKWIRHEVFFYHFPEFMLATLIQRYDKKIISFLGRSRQTPPAKVRLNFGRKIGRKIHRHQLTATRS